MKIVYMGTPDYAVGALEALIAAGHQVTAVLTQPDKPKGRGREMQMTPVKQCALQHGIPVFQPVRVKEAQAVEVLRSYEADVFVVAAFGQILSEEILQMPKYGCINIHASLLPRYRGAGPIQWAVINGEKESGITIMQMDKGIDTGDILLQSVVPVSEKETGDSLHDKLAAEGARLIVEALAGIEAGKIIPRKQKDEDSCYARRLDKSMGKIDWDQETVKIERLVRGLTSWPGTYTFHRGKTLKIWESDISQEKGADGREAPGTVTAVEKDAFYVRTKDGALKVSQVQLEGKKKMTVRDFLLGYQIRPGEMLGEQTIDNERSE